MNNLKIIQYFITVLFIYADYWLSDTVDWGLSSAVEANENGQTQQKKERPSSS